MSTNKRINITKKKISDKIESKSGLSNLYINEIIDDFLEILKTLIKENHLNIKNFGTFKVRFKKERYGRNPKNKKIYKISARRSLSFTPSKKLNKEINKF